MSNFVASFEMGCIVSIDFSIVEHALINSRVVPSRITERLLSGRKESNQTNKQNSRVAFSMQTFISTQIVYRMQLIWMYTDFHPHHKMFNN